MFSDWVSNLCKSNAIICNFTHKLEMQNILTFLKHNSGDWNGPSYQKNKVLVIFSINKGQKSTDSTVEKCTLRWMLFWEDQSGNPKIIVEWILMFTEHPNALQQTFHSWIKSKGLILKSSSDHHKTGLEKKMASSVLQF